MSQTTPQQPDADGKPLPQLCTTVVRRMLEPQQQRHQQRM